MFFFFYDCIEVGNYDSAYNYTRQLDYYYDRNKCPGGKLFPKAEEANIKYEKALFYSENRINLF